MSAGRRSFPIIASITKPEQIEAALMSKVEQVILMTGDILHLAEVVDRLHDANKNVYVHVEMVGGIGRDQAAVQYLAEEFRIDGVVSTKSQVITAARQAGIASIQRIFAIDTAAVDTAVKMIASSKPDMIELMPGLMPRVIAELKARLNKPLIVGGLIRHDEEIATALESGANYVSIGDQRFW